MNPYSTPEIEIFKAHDIITTSSKVETDKIPFCVDDDEEIIEL